MSPNDRKAELVRRGITVQDIARALGVSGGHVSRVIAGERDSPTVQQAVADALGKSISDVFGKPVAARAS